ncbi:(2Fe-2S)-binding protein [Vineibacter terrae]|uniref:(2Fe-2S)-binding protein n=1 Tax=Vineibacter terrae TaxID=2586908 RepID=UPI002E358184|nr:(2Fe-2S)-binding protein [Vineibacter terrae]HEX2888311.1 (2Fe-2S)-binding protein [Vineibacter terrae]
MADTPHDRQPGSRGIARRSLVAGTVAAGAATSLTAHHSPAEAQMKDERGDAVDIRLQINGKTHRLALDPRTSLLDALRDHAGLTGAKKGCDHGQCGACTVHLDGQRVLSCLMFAVMAEGHAVTTIEGLAGADGTLHPMQQAFIDHDAFQCGYCTPGQIMSAVACVQEKHAGSAADIREFMSGNLCRCAAYPNIVAAVEQAKSEMERT